MYFLQLIQPGLPRGLRFIGFSNFHGITDVATVVKGFPSVQVLSLDDTYWMAIRNENGKVRKLEPWPTAIMARHKFDRLMSHGCEVALAGQYDP